MSQNKTKQLEMDRLSDLEMKEVQGGWHPLLRGLAVTYGAIKFAQWAGGELGTIAGGLQTDTSGGTVNGTWQCSEEEGSCKCGACDQSSGNGDVNY